jgi:ribosomal-protein-alanine N-acetyltransferase
MKNPIVIGEKVYLRPLEREDAATIQPWVNDPETTRFMLLFRPMDQVSEEQFIDRVNRSETEVVFGVARPLDDVLIGVSGLHQINWKNRNGNFGITIGDKSCWNQGLGTETTALVMQYAFDTLNLHRVTLQVFEYNARAIRVYEKLGFQKEGVLREEHFREGRYWDTIFMGLLREEWRQLWTVKRNDV